MITTDQIRGPARRARLGRLTAFRARRRGRLDAPRLRPLLPVPPPREPGARPDDADLPGLPDLLDPSDLPEIVTPFVMEVHSGTLRAVGQLRSRMLRKKRRAVIRIQAESVRVVTQYDVRAEPSPAALARYGAMVGAWRADAELCRARATALTHEADQRLACYWDAVWLTVRSTRAEEHRRATEPPRGRQRHRFPPTARTPEAARANPDGPAHPLFTARPAHWLPGRVTLDASWDDVDAWLLTGGTPAQDPPARTRVPAVARALEILDTQPRRDGADTPAGQRPRPAADRGRRTR
ncbi:hypothetical protein [Streptomyces albireticuli]|uniref:Uncharacterized protein n=1 Tax=Streptomyces albireticuli TaxID=1940 RepID=A0A2A2D2K2_9ACTN|nr:hypothetical protein [Streptomyces albireticuli]MCD9195269.1 hypothetical protein [Streptomyces albireticuli]PAU45542.1 hypothetical protein CK936_28935 [Streptomyces albireticuli]